MKTLEKDKYKIKVLDKVFKILELFDKKGRELTVTQIHGLLGLNKASTFRILKNLEDAGYLEKDPDTLKYKLGLRIYYLGSLAEPHTTIKKIARPLLEKLNEKCNETIHLAVLHHGQALYLDKIEGNRTIRVITRVGTALPAHCSGVGKVLLAALSEKTLDEIIRERGLPRFTNNTITDLGALKTELAKIRKREYAIDDEEIEEGLKCAAAPLCDSGGRVVAAISMSVPRERFDKETSGFISMVKKTAQETSQTIRRRGAIEPS